MAWVFLAIAGAFEIAWAAGLKKLASDFSWSLALGTLGAMGLSIVTLCAAMTKLPLGISYPIWTGIGSVGALLVSVLAFGQTLSFNGVLGIVLLCAGMLLLGADAP